MIAPTEKQLQVIRYIENNLPSVKFSGATKEEARQFISDNIRQSKHVRFEITTYSLAEDACWDEEMAYAYGPTMEW